MILIILISLLTFNNAMISSPVTGHIKNNDDNNNNIHNIYNTNTNNNSSMMIPDSEAEAPAIMISVPSDLMKTNGLTLTKCTLKTQCSCITETGKLVSFKGIGRLTAKALDGKSEYIWEPCGKFNIGKIKGVTIAQHVFNDQYYDLGVPASVNFDAGTSTFQYKTVSGDASRNTYVTLTCNLPGKTTWSFVNEFPTKTYAFILKSPFACPGYAPPTSSTESSGLSTGSILTIVFFVLVVLYLVAGVAYNIKVKQANGIERMPNSGFWSGVPGLVRDGFKLTFSCCKSRDTTYGRV